MLNSKIEFAVNMTCNSCVESVKKSLDGIPGIKSVDVNLENQSVVVDSVLPITELQNYLESTGKQVKVKGHAGSLAGVSTMEAGDENVQGVVRFMQVNPEVCLIDGTVDGLRPGCHRVYVHEFGDISDGCNAVGDIYNPTNIDAKRLYGDIGEIRSNEIGRASFRLEDGTIKLSDIIGRSLVIAEQGAGGKQGNRVACGIIARSAGLFENPKTICACDGVTIWDEKKSPKKASL